MSDDRRPTEDGPTELELPAPEARLEAAIARLGADYEPPQGWKQRVLAAIAESPRRSRWPLFGMPVFALAATTLVWFHNAAPVVARVEVVKADHATYRGVEGAHRWLSARPDDHVHAVTGIAGAIRIYRDGELFAGCSDEVVRRLQEVAAVRAPPARCQAIDSALDVDARLVQPGEYTILIFETETAGTSGDLDGDKAAAMRAGIETTEHVVRVQ